MGTCAGLGFGLSNRTTMNWTLGVMALKSCMLCPEFQYNCVEMAFFPVICPLWLNLYEIMGKGSNICILFCFYRRHAINMPVPVLFNTISFPFYEDKVKALE